MGNATDLTDADVKKLVEVVKTKDKRGIVQCVLGFKSLLSEVQQQLLLLMDSEDFTKTEPFTPKVDHSDYYSPERLAYPEDTPSASNNLSQALLDDDSSSNQNEDADSISPAKDDMSDDDGKEEISQPTKTPPSKRKSPPKKLSLSNRSKVACEICGVETTKQHMSRHMLKHTGVKAFQCEQCPTSFCRNDKLKQHIRKYHENVDDTFSPTSHQTPPRKVPRGSKQYECPSCDFIAATRKQYREHRKEQHSVGKRIYRCEQCNKEFSCPSHLEQHNIKHRGEKPYVCEMCGVCFSREPNLARHVRSHINPARYRCSYCDKPYHRQNELVVHERKHTGEKPFICEICGAGYTAKKYLKRHLFMHTGLKPFTCDVCEKSFARLENMRAHRKTHNKEKPRSRRSNAAGDTIATAFHASQNMDIGTSSGASAFQEPATIGVDFIAEEITTR